MQNKESQNKPLTDTQLLDILEKREAGNPELARTVFFPRRDVANPPGSKIQRPKVRAR